MYKVFFTNFGWYSTNGSETFEGAKKVARKAGFVSSTIAPNGEVVGTYDPILGWSVPRRRRLEYGDR